MIKIPEAAARLKKVHPEVRIIGCSVFDSNYYLFTAPSNESGIDYNDPYYLVGIYDGSVYTFTPAEYLDEFVDAIKNRSVDLRKVGISK